MVSYLDYIIVITYTNYNVQFAYKEHNIIRFPNVFHYIDDMSPYENANIDFNNSQLYIGVQDPIDSNVWTIEYSPERVQSWKDNILNNVRNIRNETLKECDWIILPDSPYTIEQRQAWCQYRTALRDLPQLIIDKELYDNIPWPIPPA
jgi:hypothetical protein